MDVSAVGISFKGAFGPWGFVAVPDQSKATNYGYYQHACHSGTQWYGIHMCLEKGNFSNFKYHCYYNHIQWLLHPCRQ